MTIALGILTPDAAVIAADTEESCGIGGAKYSGFKIFSRRKRDGSRSFAASGAGDARVLDAIHQDFGDQFVDPIQSKDLMESRFQMSLRGYFKDYLLPFAREERPEVEVVAAITNQTEPPALLVSHLNRLRRAKRFVAVGAGEQHATSLLTRMVPPKWGGNLSLTVAAQIAAFVIFHVKEYVAGCGKGTHVTVLQNGGAWYVCDEAIRELEAQFEAYLALEGRIFEGIIGTQDRTALVTDVTGLVDRLGIPLSPDALVETENEAVFD